MRFDRITFTLAYACRERKASLDELYSILNRIFERNGVDVNLKPGILVNRMIVSDAIIKSLRKLKCNLMYDEYSIMAEWYKRALNTLASTSALGLLLRTILKVKLAEKIYKKINPDKWRLSIDYLNSIRNMCFEWFNNISSSMNMIDWTLLPSDEPMTFNNVTLRFPLSYVEFKPICAGVVDYPDINYPAAHKMLSLEYFVENINLVMDSLDYSADILGGSIAPPLPPNYVIPEKFVDKPARAWLHICKSIIGTITLFIDDVFVKPYGPSIPYHHVLRSLKWQLTDILPRKFEKKGNVLGIKDRDVEWTFRYLLTLLF